MPAEGWLRCLATSLLLTARHSGPQACPKHGRESLFPNMSSPVLTLLSAAASAGDAPPAWVQFLPLIGIAGVFWFLLLRPQMRQQKEHREKISSVKKGDQVVTGGGLVGKVVRIDDMYADIELAPNVKVKAVKATITDILSPTGTGPAND